MLFVLQRLRLALGDKKNKPRHGQRCQLGVVTCLFTIQILINSLQAGGNILSVDLANKSLIRRAQRSS